MAGIGWQEAVARLAGERTRAEACAALLKAHGTEADRAHGALLYAEAKAEVDAVIGGLVAAIADGRKPKSLPDLEARLQRGVEARERFREQVVALLPALPPGTARSEAARGISDVLGLGELVTSLVEAAKELVLRWADEDALTRKTIRTQLDATRWREFADVAAMT